MSNHEPRPIVKTVTRKLTYFGTACVQVTEHHDKKATGLRTIRTEWLGKADERNGGYDAGTVTERVVRGDGRLESFEVVEATRVVTR
jgi:hypothetical protein